jgi:hypothetical protein
MRTLTRQIALLPFHKPDVNSMFPTRRLCLLAALFLMLMPIKASVFPARYFRLSEAPFSRTAGH